MHSILLLIVSHKSNWTAQTEHRAQNSANRIFAINRNRIFSTHTIRIHHWQYFITEANSMRMGESRQESSIKSLIHTAAAAATAAADSSLILLSAQILVKQNILSFFLLLKRDEAKRGSSKETDTAINKR